MEDQLRAGAGQQRGQLARVALPGPDPINAPCERRPNRHKRRAHSTYFSWFAVHGRDMLSLASEPHEPVDEGRPQPMAAFSYRSSRVVTTMVAMTAVFAILKARPERVGQVQQELLELKRLTREEVGAVGYEVFRGDDGVFLVFEHYVDRSACDAHFATPYVSAFLARVPELLTGEPQVQFATEVSDSNPS